MTSKHIIVAECYYHTSASYYVVSGGLATGSKYLYRVAAQ